MIRRSNRQQLGVPDEEDVVLSAHLPLDLAVSRKTQVDAELAGHHVSVVLLPRHRLSHILKVQSVSTLNMKLTISSDVMHEIVGVHQP